MDNAPHHSDAMSRIMNLMKATFGDKIKQYYEGDPIEIPQANMPAMIFEEVAGRSTLGATSHDDVEREINIHVVLDKADDYGKSDDYDMTERRLRNFVVGLVDARPGEYPMYYEHTVVGALRKQFTLADNIINSTIDWQYDIVPRSDTLVTSEALVSIVTTERVYVPGRT